MSDPIVLLFKAAYIAVFTINLSIGTLVLAKNFKKASHLTFFLLILILNGWVVGSYFDFTARDVALTEFGIQISFMFGALIVPSFMLFVYTFPQKSDFKVSGYVLILLLSAIFSFVALSFTNSFYEGIIISDEGLNQLVVGQYTWAYSLFIILFVSLCLSLLTRKINQTSPLERLKLRYVLYGFVAASSVGVVCDLILQPLLKASSIGSLGSLATVFISLGLGYAILRYRLMDIHVVIRQGMVRFFTFSLMLGFYAFALILLKQYIGDTIGIQSDVMLIIIVLVVGITAEPLRRWTYAAIDRIFSGRERGRQEAVQRLDMLTRSVSHVEEILRKTALELSALLPGYSVALLIKGDTDAEFADEQGMVKMPVSSAAHDFFTTKQEVLVVDEIPYKLQRFSEMEVRQLDQSRDFFEKNSIKAVMPFGTGERLIALVLIISSSKRQVLFSDQIELIKKIHATANAALVNAEMYRRALERAVKNAR